jgi:four helix bundle protein
MTSTDQQHEALETAVALFKDIYRETETWPKMEIFDLYMDIRRAAMGISMNLTEGKNRDWGGESREFVNIARNDLAELRRQLLLAQNNAALSTDNITGLLQQIDRLDNSLQGLADTLR